MTMKYHYIPSRMAETKRVTIANAEEDVQRRDHTYIAGRK